MLAACTATPVADAPTPPGSRDEPLPGVEIEREPIRTGPGAKRARTGLLEVIVSDETGRRRPEIPVRITAPLGARMIRTTDARGVVRERLAPGLYRVGVVTGCRGRMMVRSGSGGRVGLTGGVIVRAPLRVEAVRRYAAGPPLLRTLEPPWPRRHEVELAFRVFDRCTDEVKADFAFPDLVFRPSGHLEIVDGSPRRTDADGYGRVTVRCIRPGNPTLILGDPSNPGDGSDLLDFTPPLDPTAEWCA